MKRILALIYATTIFFSCNSPTQKDIPIGQKLLQSIDTTKLIDSLNIVIQIDSNNANSYYRSGLIFLAQKRYRDAIKNFSKAIKIKPDYAEAYEERADAEFDGELFSDEDSDVDSSWAWGNWCKAIQLNPKFAKAYYDRGIRRNLIENNIIPSSGCPDICKAVELGYPCENCCENCGKSH